MSDLTWQRTPDGYQSVGYRIRRLDGQSNARWRLEAVPSLTPWVESRPTPSTHPSLGEARGRAACDERQRMHRARVTGHLALGTGSALAFVVIAGTALARSATGFVSTMGLFYLALRSFADAIELWLGSPAAPTPDRAGSGRLTWLGRGVLAIVEGAHRRYLAAARAEPEPAVRTLPPRPIG